MDKIHLSFLDVLLLKTSKIIKIRNRKRLSKYGLILPIYKTDSLSEKPKWYKISDKGIDYLLYRKDRIFDKIFTPVVVTILTNLVINGIEWLLQQIQYLK